MTHEQFLTERYADLLAADDDARSVIAALDAVYAVRLPEEMAARLEIALAERIGAHSQAGAGAPATRAESRRSLARRMGIPFRRVPHGPAVSARPAWWQALAATTALFAVVALLVAVLHASVPAGGAGTPAQHFARVGGLRIVVHDGSYCPLGACPTAAELLRAEAPVLTARLANGLGVHNAIIQAHGADGLEIELPGVTQPQMTQVRALLMQGDMHVLDSGSVNRPIGSQGEQAGPGSLTTPLWSSADVNRASVVSTRDSQSGQPIVVFGLNPPAQATVARFTASHIGDYITILIDDIVIESAILESPLTSAIQIAGFPDAQTAARIALFLRYGPLPWPLGVDSVSLVAPSASA
ncbi:MAG: hypothetical protein ACHQ4H_03285 [Ktedonobacterales bacterium]